MRYTFACFTLYLPISPALANAHQKPGLENWTWISGYSLQMLANASILNQQKQIRGGAYDMQQRMATCINALHILYSCSGS